MWIICLYLPAVGGVKYLWRIVFTKGNTKNLLKYESTSAVGEVGEEIEKKKKKKTEHLVPK